MSSLIPIIDRSNLGMYGIFSGLKSHVLVIYLAYPCHNFFWFHIIRPANEIQLVIELRFDFCIQLHSVHQAQHDFKLFATGAPAGSIMIARLWRGRSRGGSSASGRPPVRRGSRCRGQRRNAATKF